jgi:hypothetical protein
LTAAGRALEAVAELAASNRERPDPDIERALVRHRHLAWPEVDRSGPGPEWGADVPDLFPGVNTIPEVPAAEVDARMIHSAIRHHGGLVVRELWSQDTCDRLVEAIDRTWDAIERFKASKQLDAAWFDPFDTDDYGLTMMARGFVMAGGTAYVPDSPRLLYELLETFDQTGVKRLVTEYFGEPPALSYVKLAQRRLEAEARGGWHQDAAVYGMDARTLNVWVPVTRCGDVAPGLEMYPRPLDHLVATVGTKGVEEYTALTEEVDRMVAEVPPSRPVFEPGDAAIFDQFLLHQTAASDDFTEKRYGFESWFFAPSTYPDPKRWIPLVY